MIYTCNDLGTGENIKKQKLHYAYGKEADRGFVKSQNRTHGDKSVTCDRMCK